MAMEQTDIGENEVHEETGRMITTKSLLDRVSEIFFILNYEATTCSRKCRSNSPSSLCVQIVLLIIIVHSKIFHVHEINISSKDSKNISELKTYVSS